jgi:hypothetical protein
MLNIDVNYYDALEAAWILALRGMISSRKGFVQDFCRFKTLNQCDNLALLW